MVGYLILGVYKVDLTFISSLGTFCMTYLSFLFVNAPVFDLIESKIFSLRPLALVSGMLRI